nr:unnamed protein product [Naegleria fowleri]
MLRHSISKVSKTSTTALSKNTTTATSMRMYSELKGTKTHNNLKEAFAGESQANRRYLFFADSDIASLFRSTADGETAHAFGHLEFLEEVGDPATGEPIGDTESNLISAIAGETHEYTSMYPGFAKTARNEGFDDVAEWFETLAKAEKSHANKFTNALNNLRHGQ